MIIKQLSVFLENRSGRLTEVTKILSDNNINISALSIAETADYGVLRMIVDNPNKAIKCLKENDLSVHSNDVICILTPDTPGALYKALEYLSEENISIAYMYGYSYGDRAAIIMKANDPQKAVEVLQSHKIELIQANNFYEI